MTAPKDGSAASTEGKPDEAADLAQAYRELVRGEQAASALEANLTNLESKLDAMLAAFETGPEGEDKDVKDEKKKGKE